MNSLKIGSSGEAVYWLRRNLNHYENAGLSESYQFDAALDEAVHRFQLRYGLLVDGDFGRASRTQLAKIYVDDLRSAYAGAGGLIERSKAPADAYGNGYEHFSLRADVAVAVGKVRAELQTAGALLTSAGGFREISVKADNSARSISSFHYSGRALDMAVGSGMEKPGTDPFVIVAEDDKGPLGCRLHRVFARATAGEHMTLRPVTYASPMGTTAVKGLFVDLTSIMLKHGFERIPAKRMFYNIAQFPKVSERYLSAEWWHFQYQIGLVHGHTTFGSELELVWPENRLALSDAWRLCRNYVFGEEWN